MKVIISILLLVLMMLSGCQQEQPKAPVPAIPVQMPCKPYFTYDQVTHYHYEIAEQEMMKIVSKEQKSDKELYLNNLLVEDVLDDLADTSIVAQMLPMGFSSQAIAPQEMSALDQIFCERKHDDIVAAACIAVYRDILVFKHNNRIVGTAKICFDCHQHIITGTELNTTAFGQSGDYERLSELLFR